MGRFSFHEESEKHESSLELSISKNLDNAGCPLHNNIETSPERRGFAFNHHGSESYRDGSYHALQWSEADTSRRNNEVVNKTWTNEIIDNDNIHRHSHDFNEYRSYHTTKSGSYLKHFCVLVIIFIFQRYIPPPPPPNQSWTEFVVRSTESCVSTAHVIYNLVIYVSFGCVQNIYSDVAYHFSPTTDYIYDMTCSISLPNWNVTHFNTNTNTSISATVESDDSRILLENLENQLISRIAAQELVMKNIAHKLINWNDQGNYAEDELERKPLSIMLTGPKGVAKYETALSIAEILLHQCHRGDDTDLINVKDRILMLQGIDYALDESDENRSESHIQSGLVTNILHHIHNYRGSGTVIIIKHIENVSFKNKQELLQLLHKTKIRFNPSATSSKIKDYDSQNLISKRGNENELVEISLGSSALIATSDIGTDKIFEVLMKEAKGAHDNLTYKNIAKAVDSEINKYFDDNQNPFNLIAPFWPLRYWDMEKVLEKIINRKVDGQNFRRIEIQNSAKHYLLNPKKIDYLKLKLADGSYLFSKNGGHELLQYQAIVEKVNDVITSKSFHSLDDVVVIEYIDNHFSMKICSDDTNSKICSQQTDFFL